MRGGQERDFRCHNGPAQIGAANGNNQTRRDNHVPPGAQHFHHQPGHGRVTHFRQFRAGHHAERQQRHQQINAQRRQYGQQRGASHIALVTRAGRDHDGTFNADEHPQGDQHGIFHLFPNGDAQRNAAEIERKDIETEGEEGQHDEQAKRHQLGQRRHQVNAGCGLDATQNQPVNYPQQDRGADDGLPGIAIAEQAQFGRIGKEAER